MKIPTFESRYILEFYPSFNQKDVKDLSYSEYASLKNKKRNNDQYIDFRGLVFASSQIKKIHEIPAGRAGVPEEVTKEYLRREIESQDDKIKKIKEEFLLFLDAYKTKQLSEEAKSHYMDFVRQNFNTITFEIVKILDVDNIGLINKMKEVIKKVGGYEKILNSFVVESYYIPVGINYSGYFNRIIK